MLISVNLFAEPETINLYTEIPVELRGTWLSLSYTEDQGETKEYAKGPIYNAVEDSVNNNSYSDKIISAEKFLLDGRVGYALYSEDRITVYIILAHPDNENYFVLILFENKIERFRSIIKIAKL